MKCLICSRQAHGYGHSDTRFKLGDPRRYPLDWAFCKRRCQDAFHARYRAWLRAGPKQEEVYMVDATECERAALRACLKFFGEAAAEIGFDKALGHYSEAEALQVIEAIVSGWTQAMVAHHEQSKYPPVRGLEPYETQPSQALSPAVEPAATLTSATSTYDPAQPFADLESDLPWETGAPVTQRPLKRGRVQ